MWRGWFIHTCIYVLIYVLLNTEVLNYANPHIYYQMAMASNLQDGQVHSPVALQSGYPQFFFLQFFLFTVFLRHLNGPSYADIQVKTFSESRSQEMHLISLGAFLEFVVYYPVYIARRNINIVLSYFLYVSSHQILDNETSTDFVVSSYTAYLSPEFIAERISFTCSRI